MNLRVRVRILRRLRRPRAGDPTRVQVKVSASAGVLGGLSALLVTLAATTSGGRRLAAGAAVAALLVGCIPLARAATGWRRAIRLALERERRGLEQAHITPAQQRSIQWRWLFVTTALGIGLSVPFTLAVAVAAVLADPGLTPGLVLGVIVATALGASIVGLVAWSSVRREIERRD